MEEINEIKKAEFGTLNNIVQEYLPGTTENELYKMFTNENSVFIGYYMENKLVGVCFGETYNKDYFGIMGIAIIHPYIKQGRGSKLLNYFENIVKSKGHKNLSVGSADGYVEHFYLKNGFVLSSLKILTENDTWTKKENKLYPISKIEKQDIYTKLVIENICYETTDKDEVCKYYGGCDRFYVFEKKIIVEE